MRSRIKSKLREQLRSRGREIAVGWTTCAKDPAIQSICAELGLKSDDRADLAKLLLILANLIVPLKRAPGRPVKWTEFSRTQLLMKYLRTRKANPRLSDEQVLRRIAREGAFAGNNPKTLVRVLRDALDIKKNPLLPHALAGLPPSFIAEANRHRRHTPIPEWKTMSLSYWPRSRE
jgi:hypothetical protein